MVYRKVSLFIVKHLQQLQALIHSIVNGISAKSEMIISRARETNGAPESYAQGGGLAWKGGRSG